MLLGHHRRERNQQRSAQVPVDPDRVERWVHATIVKRDLVSPHRRNLVIAVARRAAVLRRRLTPLHSIRRIVLTTQCGDRGFTRPCRSTYADEMLSGVRHQDDALAVLRT